MDRVDKWIRLISNSSRCLHWRWFGQGRIGPGTPRELQAVQGVETLGDGAWQIEIQIHLMANTSAKFTNTSTNTNLHNCPAHLPVDEALRDQARGQSC